MVGERVAHRGHRRGQVEHMGNNKHQAGRQTPSDRRGTTTSGGASPVDKAATVSVILQQWPQACKRYCSRVFPSIVAFAQ